MPDEGGRNRWDTPHECTLEVQRIVLKINEKLEKDRKVNHTYLKDGIRPALRD